MKKLRLCLFVFLVMVQSSYAGMDVFYITPDNTYGFDIDFRKELIEESKISVELLRVTFEGLSKDKGKKIKEVELLLYEGKKLKFRTILHNSYEAIGLNTYHSQFMLEKRWIKDSKLKLSGEGRGYFLLHLRDFIKLAP